MKDYSEYPEIGCLFVDLQKPGLPGFEVIGYSENGEILANDREKQEVTAYSLDNFNQRIHMGLLYFTPYPSSNEEN
jgi:hypothetical protein